MRIYLPMNKLEELKYRYLPKFVLRYWPAKFVEVTTSTVETVSIPTTGKKNLPN